MSSLQDALDNSNCPHCSSSNLYTKERSPHVGLYCQACDRWLRWLPQGKPISVMPFGKYRNVPIRELPIDYLNWVLENLEIRGSLFKALSEEFERRGSEVAV